MHNSGAAAEDAPTATASAPLVLLTPRFITFLDAWDRLAISTITSIDD
jgi:hypothetical protein